jgi:hypothetical protein
MEWRRRANDQGKNSQTTGKHYGESHHWGGTRLIFKKMRLKQSVSEVSGKGLRRDSSSLKH